eukprot:4900593-Alexandrium_andersonii.AAC.1
MEPQPSRAGFRADELTWATWSGERAAVPTNECCCAHTAHLASTAQTATTSNDPSANIQQMP